ncbi:deoxynucleoside kinase [Parageobacillus genomosp. 1]|jgi:deoxyguanosine kinase|uniref:Deoxynucleoside kinase n=1 Tax=Parageobacillus genomosp. 1 TaxID=1295642 RepID=A0ABC9V9R6_9BACL|nr:deoxynucleoside kinase [Parageobacillus genomosp. 1]EZP74833.1 deoxynucleoside kinase [Parageobacillus genomosp. 1]
MRNVPFVAVEGPIGVGKTSLAAAIAKQFHYHLVKEIVEENPFLGKFYENMEEWSFQTEMFFLCHRYKQLEEIQHRFLQQKVPVVADYHMMKNLIFAKKTLKDHHYQKYEKIYNILTEGLPQPNIIIYLHASLDTLLTRIQQRGRDFEKNIDPLYLQQLCTDYEEIFSLFEREHPHVPVLRLNGDELDFVQRKEDLHYIFEQINHVVKGVSS